MSKETLKFDNVEVNKKEFHASKQPIALNLVCLTQILTSKKFKHSDTGPLCVILPKMSGCTEYFDNDGKICLL